MSQNEEGRLLLGQAEQTTTVQRGVALGERTLVLDGFRGSVSLTGAEVDAASLVFTKRARGRNEQDADGVLERITLEETGDEVVYRYIIRAKDPELSSVDVVGEVPRGARVDIRLSDGNVALSGIDGPLGVTVENGNVDIGGAGKSVTVETHNGSVDLGLYRLPAGSAARVRTTNGNLMLTVPGSVAASVEAQTSAGGITTEGLDFSNRRLDPAGAGARFQGRLGSGGAIVTLRTENGSIALREGSVLRLPPRPGEAETAPDTTKGDTLRAAPAPLSDTLRAPADTTGL